MKSFGGPKSTIYAWITMITFFDLIEIKNISIVKWHVPCSWWLPWKKTDHLNVMQLGIYTNSKGETVTQEQTNVEMAVNDDDIA